jgi:TetR/AcrR family transcriptional regulator, cholesterol catabolism regulator
MPRPSRRAEVRLTAARVFRERGYRSATMDDIADAVGLNKGTLYHYYPSKSALLSDLLSDQIDATLNLLAQVPLTGSGAERMRSFVRAQVAHVATKHDELVVFFQEMHWIDGHLPPLEARAIRQGIYRYEEFVKSLLTEGARTGEFRDLDPSSVLYSIIGVLAYLPVWYRTPPGGDDELVVEQVTEFIMNGIIAPATAVKSNPAGEQKSAVGRGKRTVSPSSRTAQTKKSTGGAAAPDSATRTGEKSSGRAKRMVRHRAS